MLEPLFARVLLERPKVEKVGSILLPESTQAKMAPTKGVVLACGPTCDDAVKEAVGKEVLFARFAGDWLKDGDKEYYVCQDEDLLAIVK